GIILMSALFSAGVATAIARPDAAGEFGDSADIGALVTTYSYDRAGAVSGISYSDGTPGVAYQYDRLGHQASVVRNGMTTTRAYTLGGLPLSEVYSGGTLGGISVTNGYDQFLRRTNLVALNSGTKLTWQSFGYDNASRL